MIKDWKEEYQEKFGYTIECEEQDLINEIEQFIESNFVSKEEVIKMVESKKISLGFNVDYRKIYNSADMVNKHNEALDDIIKELKGDK